jgi:hypothetical protein
MPERQDAGLLTGHVARTEDRVGMAGQQRPQQARVFGGVVFQVGILNQREIAGSLFNFSMAVRTAAPFPQFLG